MLVTRAGFGIAAAKAAGKAGLRHKLSIGAVSGGSSVRRSRHHIECRRMPFRVRSGFLKDRLDQVSLAPKYLLAQSVDLDQGAGECVSIQPSDDVPTAPSGRLE
jgi:hypothetical protein